MNRRSFFLAPLVLVVPAAAPAGLSTYGFTASMPFNIAAAVACAAHAIKEFGLQDSADWIEQQGGFEPPEDTQ